MIKQISQSLRRWAEKDGRGYPDWATRYLPIVRRLQAERLAGKRILEIGANENGLARFSGAKVIAVDIAFAHLQAAREAQGVLPLQADIAQLPVADGSMDVIACVDTFEHLPVELRQAAIAAILRALAPGGCAVIAFPAGEAARKAEDRVRRSYRRLCGESIPWLEEHVACGLPDAQKLYHQIQDAAQGKFTVRQEKNTSLWLWEWMWLVLMCNWPGRGNAVFQALLRLLCPVWIRIHWGSCYRCLIWIEAKSLECAL